MSVNCNICCINSYTIIVGTVSYDPTDDRFLLFTVDADTIPQNTLDAVNAIVDPQRKGPGTVAGLPAAAAGQRYLLINDTGSDSNTDPGFAKHGEEQTVQY